MGTESTELLIEEYKLTKRILEAGDVQKVLDIEAVHKATSDYLLEERDAFIAARIDQTLQAGETGILFLGMLHNLDGRLSKDINVLYPMNRPFDKRKK